MDSSPLIGLGVVFLFFFIFLISRFLLLFFHCRNPPSNPPITFPYPISATAFRGRESSSGGLDRSVIDTFPTIIFSALEGKGSAPECGVCLNEFKDGESLRLLPCNHAFHPECIDAWFKSRTTCCICRADLAPRIDDSVQRGGVSDIEAQYDGVDSSQTTVTDSGSRECSLKSPRTPLPMVQEDHKNDEKMYEQNLPHE